MTERDFDHPDVVLCPDGPLLLRNAASVQDADGTVHPVERPVVALCRCEKSSDARTIALMSPPVRVYASATRVTIAADGSYHSRWRSILVAMNFAVLGCAISMSRTASPSVTPSMFVLLRESMAGNVRPRNTFCA